MIPWEPDFIIENQPSIAYLELYAVTVGVVLWIHKFKNTKIALFCDNMSVVYMINNASSKCGHCMNLIRVITLQGLLHNVVITAKHVVGKSNVLSVCLSRLKIKKFREITNNKFKPDPLPVPTNLWPLKKIYFYD